MMKTKRTIFTVLSLILVLATVLAACASPTPETIIETVVVEGEKIVETVMVEVEGETKVVTATPEPEAEEPIVIRFAGWIGMEESTAKQFNHMVEVFEAQHPNVTIEYEGIAWENTRQQLLLEASSGNPPDVAQVAAPWIGQFAYSGAIEPLENWAGDILPDYVEGVVDSYTFPGADGETHTWGLPWVAVHDAIFYNTELMRQAGLDTENLPQTIDEFEQVVRAIAALGTDDQGNKIWGYTTATDRSELTANIFNAWLFNFGGDVLDDEGNVIINNEAGVKALTFMKKLVDDGIMPAGFPFRDQYNLMVNYQTGGFSDGSYARDVLRITSGKGEEFDADFTVGLHPTALENPEELSQHKSIFHHHTLVMFSQSKNKEMAYEFLKFLSTDPEITLYYAQGSSLFPLYKPALEDPFYSQDAYAQTFLDALPGSKLYGISKTPQYAQAVDFIAIAVSKALSGGDPQQALDEAAANLKVLYKQQ
ncbi:MAG: extracellular solute-binding protein [Anaerolineales bacterium]|jgi:multiple sugar transport system substrate-binding protein